MAREICPDGQRIVTASSDTTARVWKASDGQLLATLSGHTGYVEDAKFSPDGQRVVTASHDNTGRVWNASNGQLITTLSDPCSASHCVRHLLPDGQRIVTASSDTTARVYRVITVSELAELLQR